MRLIKHYWWVFLLMAGAGIVCGVAVATAILFYTPPKFMSEAVIEIKPMSQERADPEFFQTELQRIKSDECLANVVARLEVLQQAKLDEQAAVRTLREMLTVDPVPGKDQMSIKVLYGPKAYPQLPQSAPFVIVTTLIKSYEECRMKSLGPVTLETFQSRDIPIIRYSIEGERTKEDELRQQLDSLAETMKVDLDTYEGAPHEPLAMARAKYDAQWDFVQILVDKVKSAPETDEPLVIRQEPHGPLTPVSPNVPLVWCLSLAGGFLLSPLLALAVIGLLRRLPDDSARIGSVFQPSQKALTL